MAETNNRVVDQIRDWRDQLIDLSKRNRLLNAVGGRTTTMRVVEPAIDEVLAKLGGEERRRTIATSWRFHYPPSEDLVGADASVLAALHAEDPEITDEREPDELLTDVASALVLSKRLRALERRASTEYMDKGLRVLYLGLGLLRWSGADGEWLESPVVMKPVTLHRASPRDPFRLLGTDDDTVVNPALAVKLETDFGLTLPDFDEAGDVATTLDAVRAAVASNRQWTLSEDVLFGAFSFHKEAMYRDLKVNEEQAAASVLVRAVAGDSSASADLAFDPIDEGELDASAPPEEMASILDADSTQRRCIVAARDGKTFVMDGPPGTGKSQTIANVIAELLASDKTVLFVSEKAAALEVVKSRLDGAGLGSFVLELHSNKATRKEVAKTLGAALSERPRPVSSLAQTDKRDAKERREALSSYADAQNEVREPFGHNLHWALGRRCELESTPQAPPPELIVSGFSDDDFQATLRSARDLAGAWGPVERRNDFLWRDTAEPRQLLARRSQISNDLRETIEETEATYRLAELAATNLGLEGPASVDELDWLRDTLRLFEDRDDIPTDWLTDANVAARRNRTEILGGLSTRWDAATGRLSAASPAWRDLPPALAGDLADARSSLGQLVPPVATDTLDVVSTDDLAGLCDWLATEGDALETAGRDLTRGLGLTDDTSLEALRAVAEVASLGLQPHRPEPTWFAQPQLEAAQRAIRALQPLVETYRALEVQLLAVFNPSIFQLDVETLYDAPTDVAPNVSRLKSRGRANRKQLAACTLSGKVDATALGALPHVRQWRATAGQLREAEAVEAAAIGPNYYQSTTTDFGALAAALAVADRAVHLLRVANPPELLGQQLGRNSLQAEDIAKAGQALSRRLDQWISTVADVRRNVPAALAKMTPKEVAGWAGPAHASLLECAEVLRAVGPILGSRRVDEIQQLCEARAEVAEVEATFEASNAADSTTFGNLYRGVQTDWSRVERASAWSASVQQRLGGPVDPAIARALLSLPIPADELDRAVGALHKRLDTVREWFGGSQQESVATELGGRIDDLLEFLNALKDTTADLDEWMVFSTACDELVARGLASVVHFCVNSGVDRAAVADVFERALLTAWIDDVLATDRRCTPTRADERDRIVREFQQLDCLLVSHAAGRVIETCNARRPTTTLGEFAIIRTESEKKRRHRPIKGLLREAGRAAQSLKPCFMMSPLTVSQYLPAELQFDAVIFDEASQVRPGDAVGAMYRGRQLIVAGDNKQLPPTTFFERSGDDTTEEYDAEAFDVFESLLDLSRGAAAIRELPLRWHYRSRHEALITYSNRAFYGSSLVTYPSATESGPDVGVAFIHVADGVYERGSARDNPVEARSVVERVIFHADNHPDKTLGVVAFSEAQATRIQWELEAARRERRDLDSYFHEGRLDGFFVKNLEMVQGDERDIILFSIGYGRDEGGRFTLNFGPINKEGGQRRLNVAVTRARYRVEVVSSITATDFGSSSNPGVNHLRGYLDFAERGSVALPQTAGGGEDDDSPLESDVAETLLEWGYEVHRHVGHAGYRLDLGVRHPEKPGTWLLGIECDGDAYGSGRTARDRDRLRQQVLEGLGWKLHRVWGPSWYRDRSGSEARLRRAFDAAQTGGMHAPTASARQIEVEVHEVDFDDVALPDWTEWYSAVWLGHPHGLQFDSALARPQLLTDVQTVVSAEGPVHRDTVVDRLKEPWGVNQARSRFRGAVEQAIESLVARGQIESTGRFVAFPDQTWDIVRVPIDGQPETSRVIERVPPSELEAAVVRMVNDSRGIEEGELTIRIARLFGWRRTGKGIADGIGSAIAAQIVEGNVERSAFGTLVPPTASAG
ncbi:MAG: DUF3320 domain-containing protein [Actinobacteria bacterium]|nr:DUF3320 domain-containing protein [Actinomycetota bacterium]